MLFSLVMVLAFSVLANSAAIIHLQGVASYYMPVDLMEDTILEYNKSYSRNGSQLRAFHNRHGYWEFWFLGKYYLIDFFAINPSTHK